MNIVGISAYYHDSAACLVQDGRIIAAAQEERFSRRKHDADFPAQAVAYCLREGCLAPGQVDIVAFYDKPWIKFERLLETYLSFAPRGIASFLKAMPLWLKEKLWMEARIRKSLTGFSGRVLFPEHHQSHAASAFFPSPFERAAIITIDGVGEWATASWGRGQGNHIETAFELHFPHSLGLLYSAFTYYNGFKVNSGEYKLMGLASYGRPIYVQDILENLMDLKEDGSFRLDMTFFNYCQGLTMTSGHFHRLFDGPPRKPEAEITQRHMDLAASIQAVTEEVMLRTARHVRRETGEKNLCLAGGVALNCVANGRILRENIFDHIWIQPAAGDAGGALGAALFAWHQVQDNVRDLSTDGRDSMYNACLGPSWTNEEITSWLAAQGYPFRRHDDAALFDRTARALAEGKVVGWFSGRMEFGPRALGSRSILADPRSVDMLATINHKIKFRESFRPLAPAVLVEDAPDYFELEIPSPYMLFTAPVRPPHLRTIPVDVSFASGKEQLHQTRSDIPAVTHLDYSARIQTVDRMDSPRFHAVLSRFKELTGCSVVINTSFNVRGEPIVCAPQEAYRCFMHTGMDMLILENNLLEKDGQPLWPEDHRQDPGIIPD